MYIEIIGIYNLGVLCCTMTVRSNLLVGTMVRGARRRVCVIVSPRATTTTTTVSTMLKIQIHYARVYVQK